MATATATGPKVAWAPHYGSQQLVLTCPHYECLYTGTRGLGKTDGLLMDFAREVGRFGRAWRGIVFRQEAVQLEEVVQKANRWFPRIFPGSRYVGQPAAKFVFPTGEELLFRHARRVSDYSKYHGWEIPWLGWEELTNWASLELYHLMKSINRSSVPGIPVRVRSTCNPYGPGHTQVKAYFIDPAPAGVAFVPDRSSVEGIEKAYGVKLPEGEALKCVTIHGHFAENRTLMDAQPNYPAQIAASALNPEQAKAWLSGDWDIVSGGMFDDLWNAKVHVVPQFTVPPGWRITRSYDWGSTKPFSVGWWAEANGESVDLPDNTVFVPPRGSKIRIGEWYGWDGRTPNVGVRMTDAAIARGIVARETEMGITGRVRPGQADSAIFTSTPGHDSPAAAMKREGVEFLPAEKGQGSRERGWSAMRRMMAESAKDRPEGPGLWVLETCRQFIRTVPVLPRDEIKIDDVDSEAEDHIADETRYELAAGAPPVVRFSSVSA